MHALLHSVAQTLQQATADPHLRQRLSDTHRQVWVKSVDYKMVEQKDVHSSSPARTPKLQLTAEQPSIGECWIPPKKIPYIQGQRRSLSKMIGRAKLHLESNPIPARDAWRAHKNLVHTKTQRPHRD